MNTNIYVYDHRDPLWSPPHLIGDCGVVLGSGVTPVYRGKGLTPAAPIYSKLEYTFTLPAGFLFVSKKEDARIAILHSGDADVRNAGNQMTSHPEGVRYCLRISTTDFSERNPADVKHKKLGSGCYLLSVRNHKKALSNPECLKQILELDAKQLEDILADRRDNISLELQEVLWPMQCSSLSIALSILCQGYLLVCANQDHDFPVPAHLTRRASEQWPEASKRVDISDVQKRRFWNIFGEQTPEELVKLIEAEWSRLKGDGDPSKVYKLIRAVVPVTEVSEEYLVATDDKLVADAFEEIEQRLWPKDDQ